MINSEDRMATPTGGRFHLWRVFSVLLIFCILSVSTSRTLLPQPDEANYANPGYNLLYNGHSGSTLYELRGYLYNGQSDMKLHDAGASMSMSELRRTYCPLPLYYFVTAAWFWIVGFGLGQVRLFSTLFGLLGLVSWYWIGRILSGSATAGLWAMTLVSLDYFYVFSASTGRMDMFCGGLGAASLAIYLLLRERSLVQALFWSHVLATLCILAHPTGVLYWLGLVFLILKFDWKSLSLKPLIAGLVPPLLGMTVLGIFIFQDPQGFQDQMRSTMSNVSGTFDATGLASIKIIRQLQLEWQHRYVEPFGLGSGVGATQRVKAIVFMAYMGAVLGGIGLKRIRRQPGHLILSILALIAIFYLGLVSPSKFYYYLVHVTSFMATCLGVLLYSLSKMPGLRWFSIVVLSAIAGIQLAGSLYRIRQDGLDRNYLPVVELIKKNTTPTSIIMASPEIWFGLEHDRFMINDPYLGNLSGMIPDVIVLRETERELHKRVRSADPVLFQYVQHILDTKKLIYQDQYYQVYVR